MRVPKLWRNRDFVALWSGQTLSMIGGSLGGLALPLIGVLTLHASSSQMGILQGLLSLPWLLFGLFVGVLVDRLPRGPLIMIADIGRGLVLGAIPITWLLGLLNLGILYAVAFLMGIFVVLFETAYQSYLPSIVEPDDLVDATSKFQISQSVSTTIGPSLAGAAVQVFSAPVTVAVDAVSFLVSAATLGLIRRRQPRQHAHEHPPILRSLAEGFRFVAGTPVLRALTGTNASYMFFFTLLNSVLLVYYSRNLALSAVLIGFTYSAGNLGSVLGAFGSKMLTRQLGAGRAIIASSFLRSIGLVAVLVALIVPHAAVVPVLMAGQFVSNFGWTQWAIHQGTTRQLITPDLMRGRVTAAFLFIVRSVTALGGFAAAVIAAALGTVPTLAIAITGVLLSTGWLLPTMRNYRSSAPSPHRRRTQEERP